MLFSVLAGSRSVLTSHHVELLSSRRCYCSCTEQVSVVKACICINACNYTQFLIIWLPQDLKCLFDSVNPSETGLFSGSSWFDISAKQETSGWGSKWLTLDISVAITKLPSEQTPYSPLAAKVRCNLIAGTHPKCHFNLSLSFWDWAIVTTVFGLEIQHALSNVSE